jgi:hypothetical protein
MAEYSWLAIRIWKHVPKAYSNSGQIAGITSTEFGLASMILAAVNIAKVC